MYSIGFSNHRADQRHHSSHPHFARDTQKPHENFHEESMRSEPPNGKNREPNTLGSPYRFPTAGRQFMYEGNFFCSRSEAACATLMQRYFGYRLREGETFQVYIGENHCGAKLFVDYMVRDVVFEYHPIQKPKDPTYWKMLHRNPPGERSKFRRAWLENESNHYHDKRRAQLDSNPHFKGKELVVARSPEEFYEKIILRFMEADHPDQPWLVPNRAKVIREFRQIQGDVTDLLESRRRAPHIRVHDRRRAA